MSASEIAAALGTTTRTVERWAKSGRLPAYRLTERVLRFDPQEVAEWAAAHRSGA